MKAQIAQEILVEVAGSLSRRKVVRSLTRLRHRLERETCDGSVVSGEDMGMLVSVCQELSFTSFEMVEILGATYCTDQAHAKLTPEDFAIAEWDVWYAEHQNADLGEFQILGGQDA